MSWFDSYLIDRLQRVLKCGHHVSEPVEIFFLRSARKYFGADLVCIVHK